LVTSWRLGGITDSAGATALHRTKRYMDAARYQGDGTSRDVCRDSDPPGFGLRV
jgi:hypothetical protein